MILIQINVIKYYLINYLNNDIKEILFVIGPEGGFADTEIAEVDEAKNMNRISIGRRILRTETAGMTVMSIIMYHLEIQE